MCGCWISLSRRCFTLNINYRSRLSSVDWNPSWQMVCQFVRNFCLEVIVKKLDLIWSVERSDISSVLVSSVCQSTTIRNFQVFSSYVPKNNKHVNRQRISGKHVELILRMNHPTSSLALTTPLFFVHTCSLWK